MVPLPIEMVLIPSSKANGPRRPTRPIGGKQKQKSLVYKARKKQKKGIKI
jgi:hypothetical protein